RKGRAVALICTGALDGVAWRGLAGVGARGSYPLRGSAWSSYRAAHNGSSLLLGAVHVWDHVCASRGVKCGFLAWEWGKYFLFFGLGEVRGETLVRGLGGTHA